MHFYMLFKNTLNKLQKKVQKLTSTCFFPHAFQLEFWNRNNEIISHFAPVWNWMISITSWYFIMSKDWCCVKNCGGFSVRWFCFQCPFWHQTPPSLLLNGIELIFAPKVISCILWWPCDNHLFNNTARTSKMPKIILYMKGLERYQNGKEGRAWLQKCIQTKSTALFNATHFLLLRQFGNKWNGLNFA